MAFMRALLWKALFVYLIYLPGYLADLLFPSGLFLSLQGPFWTHVTDLFPLVHPSWSITPILKHALGAFRDRSRQGTRLSSPFRWFIFPFFLFFSKDDSALFVFLLSGKKESRALAANSLMPQCHQSCRLLCMTLTCPPPSFSPPPVEAAAAWVLERLLFSCQLCQKSIKTCPFNFHLHALLRSFPISLCFMSTKGGVNPWHSHS